MQLPAIRCRVGTLSDMTCLWGLVNRVGLVIGLG